MKNPKEVLDDIDPGIFYIILVLLKSMVWILDIILDLALGTTIAKGSREERLKARKYEHSAQRVSVLARGSGTFMLANNDKNFLTR